jgi:hypothetical protein
VLKRENSQNNTEVEEPCGGNCPADIKAYTISYVT